VDDVKRDIDAVHKHVETLRRMATGSGQVEQAAVRQAAQTLGPADLRAFGAALNWLACGATSVFLQDANSLVIKPADLVEILKHLKDRFPQVERVTSYARSHTLARMKDDDLRAIRDAGLTRVHTGLESGSDRVLKMVKKGVTKEQHIKAGLKVKKAGLELSEYYMPGLGGRALWREHALETADALNQINPDFIRLRSLAVPITAPLFEEWEAGTFERCTDVEVAEEILLFLEALDGISSTVKSDHILNLFGDVEGALPRDKRRMAAVVGTFLAMEPDRRRVYQIGRRLGVFASLSDMNVPQRLEAAERACDELGVDEDNVDDVVDRLTQRFL
jgi:hypothetical protein